MVQALQARGVPVIVFGTAMSTHLPLLRRTGADVLGCDWRIELDQARTLVGPNVALQETSIPWPSSSPARAGTAGGGHPSPRRSGGAHLEPRPRRALAASEVFDPTTGKFSALGTFQIERLDHSAVLLTDGRVLVVGGARGETQFQLAVPETELFDPGTGQWAPGPRLHPAWRNATATMLGNGRVLLFGGADAQGFPRPNVFLFEWPLAHVPAGLGFWRDNDLGAEEAQP